MRFEYDRKYDKAGEPSIKERIEKAIEILRKNKQGYFLLVEGGKIGRELQHKCQFIFVKVYFSLDHAHHRNNAFRALHELLAFDAAIEQAVNMTSETDTLIIVSADHSHVFTMGGNSVRGNPIFGKKKD